MSNAVSSFRTLVKLSDMAVSPTFTTIAEVLDIDGPAFEQGTEETTNHSSPDRKREFISTLKTAGEVSFDLNFFADLTQGPTGGLFEAYEDGGAYDFQIIFPTENDDQLDFSAIVTSFEFSAPVEGKLTAAITLQTTGDWAWS